MSLKSASLLAQIRTEGVTVVEASSTAELTNLKSELSEGGTDMMGLTPEKARRLKERTHNDAIKRSEKERAERNLRRLNKHGQSTACIVR